MKEILTVIGGVLLVVILMLGYNLYNSSKQREMYKLCLESRNPTTLSYCSPPR